MLNLTKRQNEIIDVSIGLIADSGIQNLTIKNISEKMEISEPAIYRHYKCKLDILLGILDYFEDSMKTMLESISVSPKSNISKLESIFLTKCQEFAQRPELAKVIFSEEIFQNEKILSDKVVSIMRVHQEAISKIIENAQLNGEMRSDIPKEHFCLIIMGSLRLIVTKWRLSNFKFDIVNLATEQWNSIKKLIAKE